MLLHAFMYLYVYVCITKCNLSSPCYLYYVFRTDGLSLDNKLAYSSLGQISFLSSNFFHLPIGPCVKLRPYGLFPAHYGIFMLLSLFRSYLGCHVGENL